MDKIIIFLLVKNFLILEYFSAWNFFQIFQLMNSPKATKIEHG